jgi:purine-nucleoside phosphorylase
VTTQQVLDSCNTIKSRAPQIRPLVGLILGSGLGGLADIIARSITIPYTEIPYFPQSRVPGHAGNLVLGYLGAVPIVAMQGRAHLYEGLTAAQATYPIRCLHAMGIKTLIVSNASGGINTRFSSGQVVAIDDHVDWIRQNPLHQTSVDCGAVTVGLPHRNRNPYDRELLNIAERFALKLGFTLSRGTYLATLGPNYETRSEYRMFSKIGADMVGMSTVPEVMVANQLGLKILAFSIITNVAKPDVQTVTEHNEVLDWTRRAQSQLIPLIEKVISAVA